MGLPLWAGGLTPPLKKRSKELPAFEAGSVGIPSGTNVCSPTQSDRSGPDATGRVVRLDRRDLGACSPDYPIGTTTIPAQALPMKIPTSKAVDFRSTTRRSLPNPGS